MKILTFLTLMVSILTTILLSSAFFTGITTSSFSSMDLSDPPSQYSPWCDFDDNGNIDIFDVVDIATRYGTNGTPVNKTELLYDVNSTLAELRDRVEYLETALTYGPYQSGRLLPIPYGAFHGGGGTTPFYSITPTSILLSLDLNGTELGDQQTIFVLEGETITVTGEFQIWGNPGEIKQLFLAYS